MRKKLKMALLVFAVMLSVPLVIGAYSEDSYAAEAQVGSLDLTGTVEIPEGGFLIDEGSQLSIGDDFVLIGNGSSIKMEAGSMVSFMEMTKVLANDVEITVDGKASLQSNINLLTQSFDAELVTNGSVEVKVFSNFAEENTEAIYVKLNSLNLTIKMAETGDADIDLEVGISEAVLNSNGSTASAKDVSVNADMLVDIPDIPTILTDYTGEGLINVTIGSFEISNETDKMSVSDITAAIDLNYKGMTDYSLDMKASVGSASYSSTNDSPDSGTDVSLQIKGMSANVNVISSLDSVVADEYAGLMVVELGVDEFSLNNSSINPNYTYKNIIDVDGLKVYGELSYSMSGQNLVIMSDSSKTNATLDYGYYLQSSGILGTESGYEATLKNVSAGLDHERGIRADRWERILAFRRHFDSDPVHTNLHDPDWEVLSGCGRRLSRHEDRRHDDNSSGERQRELYHELRRRNQPVRVHLCRRWDDLLPHRRGRLGVPGCQVCHGSEPDREDQQDRCRQGDQDICRRGWKHRQGVLCRCRRSE